MVEAKYGLVIPTTNLVVDVLMDRVEITEKRINELRDGLNAIIESDIGDMSINSALVTVRQLARKTIRIDDLLSENDQG